VDSEKKPKKYNYVPAGSETNLREYKYHGSDTSITYNYILSPLAEFLVKFFPK